MTKKYFIAIATILFLASCANIRIQEGLRSFEELQMRDAIQHLEKGLAKKDNAEARKALAEAYRQTNQPNKAIEAYKELALKNADNDDDRIEYGKALMQLGDYKSAEEIFSGILSREPSNASARFLKTSCAKAEEFKADSALFDVQEFNVQGLEISYSPVITSEGMLVTGVRNQLGPKDNYTNQSFTDLFSIGGSADSTGVATQMKDIDARYHDGIAAISGDEQTLYVTRSNYDSGNRLDANKEDVSTTQIYEFSRTEEGEWGEAKKLAFMDADYMYAHPAISVDNSTLFFSSDMKGGFGGMDLWKVTKTEQGEWGVPTNLGETINSPGDEVFPTLRGDSLFFSSDEQLTLGGLDILYAVPNGDSWSGPYHLPYPMNSTLDDFGVVYTGSNTGYLSSERSGTDRIYQFESFDPEVVLKGLVTSKNTEEPISGASVTVQNLTDGTESTFTTDDVGMFEMDLVPGKQYKVRVEKDGFFATTENVDTRGIRANEDINLNLSLLELSNPDGIAQGGDGNGNGDGNGSGNGNGNGDGNGIGSGNGSGSNQNANGSGNGNSNSPYSIPDIHWDYDKWEVREDAKPYLDSVVKLLKDNPDLTVEISSHCDSRGSYAYNDNLSQRRAKAVVDYLISKGINRNKLISRGYGERQLVNGCKDFVPCSEAQHQDNRRTDFKVLNK